MCVCVGGARNDGAGSGEKKQGPGGGRGTQGTPKKSVPPEDGSERTGRTQVSASWSLGATLTRLQDPGPHGCRRHHCRHGSRPPRQGSSCLSRRALAKNTRAARPAPPSCRTSSFVETAISPNQSLADITPDSAPHTSPGGYGIGQKRKRSRPLPRQGILLAESGKPSCLRYSTLDTRGRRPLSSHSDWPQERSKPHLSLLRK